MNNLLGAVQDGFQDEPDSSDDEETLPSDVESGKQHKKGDVVETPKINYMEHFFREMDNIKQDVEAVGQATRAVRQLHEAALSATNEKEEAQLSQQLKPIIDATNNRAKRTKTLLGLLQQETEKLKEEGVLNASDLRVRQNLNTTITRKFVDEMKVYQSAQQDYKNAIKSKASRQIRSIQPDASDEQVEQVMRSEGGREALMKQAVLSNSVNDQIQNTFDKVAGKYQDVLTLEQSVAELHQMFLDFALLTEQQGELLGTFVHMLCVDYCLLSTVYYLRIAFTSLFLFLPGASKFCGPKTKSNIKSQRPMIMSNMPMKKPSRRLNISRRFEKNNGKCIMYVYVYGVWCWEGNSKYMGLTLLVLV
jgi:t-SNARE complex subunit (syntaxin)